MVNGQEPAESAAAPAVWVQELSYSQAGKSVLAAPWRKSPIQSVVVGLATLLNDTVTLAPGATAVGLALTIADPPGVTVGVRVEVAVALDVAVAVEVAVAVATVM